MLSKRKKYLQIALNSTLDEARQIIGQLPQSDRILVEAGTPLLKRYGAPAIRQIKDWWQERLWGTGNFWQKTLPAAETIATPYVVADYKAMDRGATEVVIAASAGASAVTVLGQAPVATIDLLINECHQEGLEAIVDMMNVDQPYKVLRKLKKLPEIVMLHRGVDETEVGDTPLPVHQINKVKGTFDVMIAIGGGDTIREVQSAFFNGAEIVMVWKEFYQFHDSTAQLAEEFLKEIK